MEPKREQFDRPGEHGSLSALVWDHAGDAAPLLIFLHANGFNANTYKRLLTPLADQMRIVALDMRGHGFSDLAANPDRLRNWYIYRDDLNVLRDTLSRGQPTVLAGHSLGAATAVLATQSCPTGIVGLFLIEPVMVPGWAWRVASLMRRMGISNRVARLSRAAAARRMTWPDAATMLNTYRGRRAFRTWPDATIADYIKGGTRPSAGGGLELTCHPKWEAATFKAHSHNLWAKLPSLNCPVHIMAGSAHSTFPPALADRVEKRLKDLTIQRIEQATHFLPMEQPERIQQELRRFMSDVTDRATATI